MARPKGSPKLGGRKKGTPNKTTALLKDATIQAAIAAGNTLDQEAKDGLQAYLTHQALNNSTSFMGLLGKVLPMQVEGTGDEGEIIFRTVYERAND